MKTCNDYAMRGTPGERPTRRGRDAATPRWSTATVLLSRPRALAPLRLLGPSNWALLAVAALAAVALLPARQTVAQEAVTEM